MKWDLRGSFADREEPENSKTSDMSNILRTCLYGLPDKSWATAEKQTVDLLPIHPGPKSTIWQQRWLKWIVYASDLY